MIKKTAALLLMIVLPLLTAGCMNGTGIGDLAVVLGASVAREESGRLSVAVELAHRTALDGADESIIVQAAAEDWRGIEDELSRKCDKELYWGHLVLLLFDRSCGRECAEDMLRLFYSDQRLAPVIYTAVCLQDSHALLEGGFGEAVYTSAGIAQRMSMAAKTHSDACFTVEKCMQSIYHGGIPRMVSIVMGEQGAEFDRMVDIDDI